MAYKTFVQPEREVFTTNIGRNTPRILTLHPPMEVFRDVPACVKYCEDRGAHLAGIVKIVPPKEWTANTKCESAIDEYIIPSPTEQHMYGNGGSYRCFPVIKRGMTVSAYRKLADSPKYSPVTNNIDEIETNYWRHLGPRKAIYGADLQGSVCRPGGTVWNMSKLGTILDSIYDEYKVKIPGVNTPYLYFGMYGASFPWHTEDMDLYSVNFLHFGAPKFWYAIPPASGRRFEELARSLHPDLHRECKGFLRHKMILISPKILHHNNIPFDKMVQNPGEIIMTFPYGYHSGFNLGYNCAESTNLASERWIEYGKRSQQCMCQTDGVKINMEVFVKRYQPERYALWLEGEDYGVFPEDDGNKKIRAGPLSKILQPKSRASDGGKRQRNLDASQGKRQMTGARKRKGQSGESESETVKKKRGRPRKTDSPTRPSGAGDKVDKKAKPKKPAAPGGAGKKPQPAAAKASPAKRPVSSPAKRPASSPAKRPVSSASMGSPAARAPKSPLLKPARLGLSPRMSDSSTDGFSQGTSPIKAAPTTAVPKKVKRKKGKVSCVPISVDSPDTSPWSTDDEDEFPAPTRAPRRAVKPKNSSKAKGNTSGGKAASSPAASGKKRALSPSGGDGGSSVDDELCGKSTMLGRQKCFTNDADSSHAICCDSEQADSSFKLEPPILLPVKLEPHDAKLGSVLSTVSSVSSVPPDIWEDVKIESTLSIPAIEIKACDAVQSVVKQVGQTRDESAVTHSSNKGEVSCSPPELVAEVIPTHEQVGSTELPPNGLTSVRDLPKIVVCPPSPPEKTIASPPKPIEKGWTLLKEKEPEPKDEKARPKESKDEKARETAEILLSLRFSKDHQTAYEKYIEGQKNVQQFSLAGQHSEAPFLKYVSERTNGSSKLPTQVGAPTQKKKKPAVIIQSPERLSCTSTAVSARKSRDITTKSTDKAHVPKHTASRVRKSEPLANKSVSHLLKVLRGEEHTESCKKPGEITPQIRAKMEECKKKYLESKKKVEVSEKPKVSKQSGKLLYLVFPDGRQTKLDPGMNLSVLAGLAKQFGATAYRLVNGSVQVFDPASLATGNDEPSTPTAETSQQLQTVEHRQAEEDQTSSSVKGPVKSNRAAATKSATKAAPKRAQLSGLGWSVAVPDVHQHSKPDLEAVRTFNERLALVEPHCSVCWLVSNTGGVATRELQERAGEALALPMESPPLLSQSTFAACSHTSDLESIDPPVGMQGANSLLLRCTLCALVVHASCYGVATLESSEWLCDACQQPDNELVSCCLCPLMGGALRRTTDERWAHVSCGLALKGAVFSNYQLRRGIDVSSLHDKAWQLTCTRCNLKRREKRGDERQQDLWPVVVCCHAKCNHAFHVPCAIFSGLHLSAGVAVQSEDICRDCPIVIRCKKHAGNKNASSKNGPHKSDACVGDTVVAKRSDGMYHFCRVLTRSKRVFYRVMFDDGTYSNDMPPEDVKCEESVRGHPEVNSHVTTRWNGDSCITGTYMGWHYPNTYGVEYADGAHDDMITVHRTDEALPQDVIDNLVPDPLVAWLQLERKFSPDPIPLFHHSAISV